MQKDDAWFAPKRFGYGAGWPIAWQGWVVAIGYVAAMVVGALRVAPEHPGVFALLAATLTVAVTALSATHTRGGWRWRWGRE